MSFLTVTGVMALCTILWWLFLRSSRILGRRLRPVEDAGFQYGFLLFAGSYLLILLCGLLLYMWLDDPDASEESLTTRLLRIAVIQGSICAAAIGHLAWRGGRPGLVSTGFNLKNRGLGFAFAAMGYLTYYPIYVLFCGLNNLVFPSQPQKIVEEIIDHPELLSDPPLLLCATLVVPVIEEILFRGFLHSGLRAYFRPVLAVLFTAIFFASVHDIQAFLPVLALGLYLSYVRERTGSVFPAMLVHAMHNSLTMFLIPFSG